MRVICSFIGKTASEQLSATLHQTLLKRLQISTFLDCGLRQLFLMIFGSTSNHRRRFTRLVPFQRDLRQQSFIRPLKTHLHTFRQRLGFPICLFRVEEMSLFRLLQNSKLVRRTPRLSFLFPFSSPFVVAFNAIVPITS